jgi:hypothetical protein
MVKRHVLDEQKSLAIAERFKPAEGQLVLIEGVGGQILTARLLKVGCGGWI